MGQDLTHIYVSTGSFESAFGNRNAAVILDELLGYDTFSHLHAVFFRADEHRRPIHVRPDVTAYDLAWEGSSRAVAEVQFVRWLSLLVRSNRPCILTAADPFLPGFNVALVARLARVPWVQYLGSDFESIWKTSGVRLGRMLPGRSSERFFERLAYRHATRLRTWNQYYCDYAIRQGARPERCFALPPSPFNDSYYSPQSATSGRSFAAPGARVIAVIQRLQADKLTSNVVDCFPTIHRALPGTRFVIAGDGPERRELTDKIRRLGLARDVDFVGHLGAPDIIALMLRADVLLGGNAGRTLVEAGLCGLETVTYDFHWHPEYVRLMDAGFVTRLFDPEAMANAALEVIARSSVDRRRLLQTRAIQAFGRETVIEQTRDFYRDLVAH